MSTAESLHPQIRVIIARFAGLPDGIDAARLGTGDDLFAAGMTSHASVNVMLALEDEFDFEFPDALLHRGSFQSVDAIAAAVTAARSQAAAP